MPIFQVYAGRKKEDESGDERQDPRFGMKMRKVAKFLRAHLEGGEMPLEAAEVAAAVRQAEDYFGRNNLSGFMSTLTPGAQNAIYAGSFLWGYENAAKYLKNAMKMAEGKNMGSTEERSREVLSSVQQQALEQNERVRASDKIIWTYYNESLKDFQSEASKTEIMVDRAIIEREAEAVPMTAKDAIAKGLEEKSSYPALLYCTSMPQIQSELELQQSNAMAEMKKEEVARLVGQRAQHKIPEAERAPISIVPDTVQDAGQKGAVSEAALSAALRRREEIIAEYERAELAIQKTSQELEAVRESDSARARELVEKGLPPYLPQILLSKRNMQRRVALQKQLKKWLALCGKGRAEISKTQPGRIAKLLSLSALLKK